MIAEEKKDIQTPEETSTTEVTDVPETAEVDAEETAMPEQDESTEEETAEEEQPVKEEASEETEPAGEEETSEGEAPTNKYAERLAKAYPDRSFETEEDYEKGLDEYLGELEGYRERGVLANQKLIALFEAEPQVGDVVRDMMNGATFREALTRHISPEDLTAIEGDPDYEGWNKNKAAREEGLNKRKTRESDYAKNLELSQQAIEEFARENDMDDAAAGKFLARFDAMLADVNSGKISKDVLTTMKRAWEYDNDVTKAREQGELAGQNKKIIAQKQAEKPKGDGLPKLGSKSEPPEVKKPEPQYIDRVFEHVEKRKVL